MAKDGVSKKQGVRSQADRATRKGMTVDQLKARNKSRWQKVGKAAKFALDVSSIGGATRKALEYAGVKNTKALKLIENGLDVASLAIPGLGIAGAARMAAKKGTKAVAKRAIKAATGSGAAKHAKISAIKAAGARASRAARFDAEGADKFIRDVLVKKHRMKGGNRKTFGAALDEAAKNVASAYSKGSYRKVGSAIKSAKGIKGKVKAGYDVIKHNIKSKATAGKARRVMTKAELETYKKGRHLTSTSATGRQLTADIRKQRKLKRGAKTATTRANAKNEIKALRTLRWQNGKRRVKGAYGVMAGLIAGRRLTGRGRGAASEPTPTKPTTPTRPTTSTTSTTSSPRRNISLPRGPQITGRITTSGGSGLQGRRPAATPPHSSQTPNKDKSVTKSDAGTSKNVNHKGKSTRGYNTGSTATKNQKKQNRQNRKNNRRQSRGK